MNDYNHYADKDTSQWYRACSAGGVNSYPYGNDIVNLVTNCNVYGHSGSTHDTVPTATLAECMTQATGYRGVYDLVGNVHEWEDSCVSNATGAPCRVRGGAFNLTNLDYDTCGYSGGVGMRDESSNAIGFRCCSK
jgi:formylglycine-generating enzyme required for sulfatase activity